MFETSSRILVVAGMVNLLVGAISGVPMGLLRQHGAETVPKYLTMVHLGGLMNGPILIAVGFSLGMSRLTPWIDTTAAVVLAVASVVLIAKDAINWRQGITDEFAQHSLGLKLGWLFGPLETIGLALATAAVLSGM